MAAELLADRALAAREMFNSLPLALFAKDPELRYVAVNPAAAQLLGRPPADVLRQTDADLFPAPVAERLRRGDLKVLQDHITLEQEEQVEVNGALRSLRFRKAPVARQDGQVGLAGCAFDWTEQRLAEAQVRHRQSKAAVAHLAGGIAHDFNNLLTAILGNLSFARSLAAQPYDPQAVLLPQLLAMAEQASHQAANLTRQLLSFARRRERTCMIDVDLNLLALEVAGREPLQPDLCEPLWPVRGDPEQLVQSIENLLRFAREGLQMRRPPTLQTRNLTIVADGGVLPASRQRGAEIRVPHPEARPGDFVRLCVLAATPGVEAAALHADLSQFEPLAEPLSYHRGASLALAMAQGLIKEHGGWLDCRDAASGMVHIAAFLPRSR